MKYDIENKGNAIILAYKLEGKEELDKFCYGMLVNNKIEGIAPVTHTQMNNDKYMKFTSEFKTSFHTGFSGIISKERLLKIFDSLTTTLLRAEEYGISYTSFLLDGEYAYFDSKSSKTILLCVPLSSFENEVTCSAFFLTLLTKIQPDTRECYDSIAKLGTFANDSANFSLVQFRDIIDELLGRPSRANIGKKEPVFQEAEPVTDFEAGMESQAAFVMGARDVSTNVQDPTKLNQKQTVQPRQAAAPEASAAQRKPASSFELPRAVPNGGFAIPGGGGIAAGKEKPAKKTKEKAQKKSKEKPVKEKAAKKESMVSLAGMKGLFIKKPSESKDKDITVPNAKNKNGIPPQIPPQAQPSYPNPVNVPQNVSSNQQSYTAPPVPEKYTPTSSNQAPQGSNNPPISGGFQPQPVKGPNAAPQQTNQNPPPASANNTSYQPPRQAAPQSTPKSVDGQQNNNQWQQGQPNQGQQNMQQPIHISVQIPSQPMFNASVDMAGGQPNVVVTNGENFNNYPQNRQPVVQNQNFGETTVLANGETTVLVNGENALLAKLYPKLTRQKTGEEISVNKPIFRIGKEKSYVDYFISDNSAISRSHANILTREGEYYIVDTNSTNHTFIDDKLIQSNVEYKITQGTKIRMANEYFEFNIN